jgi:flagellar protein FlaG
MDISSINNAAALLNPTAEALKPQPVPPAQRELIQAVKAINAADLFGSDNELTFILDRQTRRAVVRIVNRDTKEVIQQIPAEYVLRLAEEYNRSSGAEI